MCSDYYNEGQAHQWSWRVVIADQMTDEVPKTSTKDNGMRDIWNIMSGNYLANIRIASRMKGKWGYL